VAFGKIKSHSHIPVPGFQLLQQEDGMLTPETRKIITKLRQLVHKRVDLKGGIATAADADVKTADQQQPTGSNAN
jgi:hypothetical protein